VRRITTLATGFAAAVGLALAVPASAWAHVTVNAPGATQGGYTTITIKVPTESDTASTTELKVQLPTDNPIASVSIQPKPGWTYTVKKAKPPVPLSNDDGPITEIVTEIDWKVSAGNAGIRPGEFDTFLLSAGPLPKVETLTFKAIQTYSNGDVVNWIETPAPGSTAEVAHPAPALTLAPAATDGGNATPSATATTSATADEKNDDNGSSWLGVVALGVAVLSLLLAFVAYLGLTSLKRTASKG